MARPGISKEDVLVARNALLARGENASIDAVRYELGNKGSRSTILRFLRELEISEPAASPKTLSSELAVLVAGLAERLKLEGRAPIAALEKQQEEERKKWDVWQKDAESKELTLKNQLENNVQALTAQTILNQKLEETRQQQTLEIVRLTQLNADQQIQLSERTQQINSLEEKHLHAREALEHYRNAIQLQREQEARRHENQVQQLQMELRKTQQMLLVKQDETMQINRDNERLLSEFRKSQADLLLLQQQHKEQVEFISSLQYKIVRLETLEESHRERLNEATKIELSYQQRLEEASRVNERLSQQIAVINEREERKNVELVFLHETVDALRQQVASTKQESAGKLL